MKPIVRLMLAYATFFSLTFMAMETTNSPLTGIRISGTETQGQLNQQFLASNPDETFKVNVFLDYVSADPPKSGLSKLFGFLNYLEKRISRYESSTAEQIIQAKAKEERNLATFAQYIVSEFFWFAINAHDKASRVITPNEFHVFKNQDVCPFSSYCFKNNAVFFSLLHYLIDKSATPVQVKNKERLYNNLSFKLRPSLGDEIGQKVDFTFADARMPDRYHDKMRKSGNTLSHVLIESTTPGSAVYPCQYDFEFFRLEANTYRVQVTLKWQNVDGSNESKIFNFIAQIESNPTGNQSLLNLNKVSNAKNSERFVVSSRDNTPFVIDPYFVRGMFDIDYDGNAPNGLAKFRKYLDDSILEYSSMEFLDEDRINLNVFAQYIVSKLFWFAMSDFDDSVVNEFRDFKNQDISPLFDHSFKNNTVFFSLLYYLNDKLAVPFQRSFNDFDFIFRPRHDDEIGEQVDFTFADVKMPARNHDDAVKKSENTLSHVLIESTTPGSRVYPCRYEFAAYKLKEKTYRVQVKLLSQDPNKPMKERNTFNFVLQVK